MRAGLIGGALSLAVSGAVLLLLALVSSIAIEWLGMALGWWTEPGSAHAARVLETEIGYVDADFRHSIANVAPIELALSAANATYELLVETSGLRALERELVSPEGARETRAAAFATDAYRGARDYLHAAVYVTQLFAVRCTIVLLSLPLFVLVAFCGSTDGLVQRELRKKGGGREYGLVYHKVKSWFRLSLFVPAFVYLASPFAIHPNTVLLPAAIVVGLLSFLVTATFKKYL